MAKTAKQLELFAGVGDAATVHALGLLGWKDPIWTTRFEIVMLDGSRLSMTLAALREATQVLLTRQLHSPDPDPPLFPARPKE